MKLHCTITSPYARKVWVAAGELGLTSRIARIPTNPHQDEYLRADNPLCRVPTLVLNDGKTLYDSPVICEYLDSLHGGHRLFPADPESRWNALKLQALGDGMMDALLARRVETLRPKAAQLQEWIDRQLLAWHAANTWLESNPDALCDPEGQPTIGDISVACALGYVAVRFPDDDWERRYEKLAQWHAGMKKRESLITSDYAYLKANLSPEMIKEGPARKLT